jgi:hypothetical protein
MASTDFTACTGNLATNVVQGVTDSPPSGVPNGGGIFSYGFGRTAAGSDGVVAHFYDAAGWIPTAKAGENKVAMIKEGKGTDSGNNLIYCPFLFVNLQGTNVTDNAYFLGLTEEEPARIMLAKGPLTDGLDPTGSNMLRLSSASFLKGTWVHLRLDVIEQPSGDVLLKVFQNADLATNPVTSPVWTAVAGMADFTDDALAYNTGTVPLLTGRMGWGARMGTESGRYVYVDHHQPRKDNT